MVIAKKFSKREERESRLKKNKDKLKPVNIDVNKVEKAYKTMVKTISKSKTDMNIAYGKVEQALKMGATLEESCFYAGITRQTLMDRFKRDLEFKEACEGWRMLPILKARRTIYDALGTDVKVAMWYLEKKLPKEFGNKAEVTVNNNVTWQKMTEFLGIIDVKENDETNE